MCYASRFASQVACPKRSSLQCLRRDGRVLLWRWWVCAKPFFGLRVLDATQTAPLPLSAAAWPLPAAKAGAAAPAVRLGVRFRPSGRMHAGQYVLQHYDWACWVMTWFSCRACEEQRRSAPDIEVNMLAG
jgi:hypothetical protein